MRVVLEKWVVQVMLKGDSSSDFVTWIHVHEQERLLTRGRGHTEQGPTDGSQPGEPWVRPQALLPLGRGSDHWRLGLILTAGQQLNRRKVGAFRICINQSGQGKDHSSEPLLFPGL